MANHPVVWFEVVGKDGVRTRRFYSELFGWKLDAPEPMRYAMIEANGKGIPGGVGESGPLAKAGFPAKPWTTFYVDTDDVAGSLARAEKLGGKTILPARQLPEGPEVGLFEDPDGNLVGLVRSRM
jgi:hypothetical protein